MKEKSFIEKSLINKKLCVHCEHCSVYIGAGVKKKIMCDFYKNKVDGSSLYHAWQSRYIPWRCGGKKWEIASNIVVCEDQQQAAFLRSEDFNEKFEQSLNRSKMII